MNEQAQLHETPDRELFVRLLIKHDRTIRAYLRSLLPTANDVDEVMQDVSVVAWRKFEKLNAPENFCRWVCVIARYEVLMYRRKKARDRFVLGQEIEQLMADEGLEELDVRERQLKALEGCVRHLPDERKQLLMRVYSGEQPMKAIATQIGKSPAALYKLVSRLRQELLQCIERQLLETSK
ncbi:MAG: sigma-70 family RNA polymerase sigma factor [Mariniblastus sp.]